MFQWPRGQTWRAKTQLECFTTVRILNPLFCSVVKETIRFHSCGRVNPSDFSDSWGMQSCPPRSHDHTKSHTATSKSHFHGVVRLEIESVRLYPHFGRREYFLCHHWATVVSSECWYGCWIIYWDGPGVFKAEINTITGQLEPNMEAVSTFNWSRSREGSSRGETVCVFGYRN